MRRVASTVIGTCVVSAAAALGSVRADTDDVRPFPTKTSTFKEDDLKFVVDGRIEIPKRAKIVSVRRATISGGDSGGVLEVSGTLELKAVTGGNVVLENVWIELTPECKSLYLSGCLFVGDAGIRPSAKGPSEARVYMERTGFKLGTSCTLDSSSGKITLSGVTSRVPVVVNGRLRGEKGSNKTELQLVRLTAYGGLEVAGVEDAVVTQSMLGGEKVVFEDCPKLLVTALLVRSPHVEFRQSEPNKFGKTSIKSIDFESEKIVFSAPAAKKGQAERVLFDFCWFGGRTDGESIRQTTIADIGQDEGVAVLATFKKIQAEQLNMVRYRPPRI